MMKSSRLVIGIAIAAISLPVLEGCKKGEGDPTISLRSRLSRISHEWNVTALDMTTTTFDEPFNSGTTRTDVKGILTGDVFKTTTKSTYTALNGDKIVEQSILSRRFVQTIEFSEEGDYLAQTEEEWGQNDTVEYDNSVTGATEYYLREAVITVFSKDRGYWNFLDGVGDTVKKKEYVLIVPKVFDVDTRTTTTFTELPLVTTGSYEEVFDVRGTNIATKVVTECSDCREVWKLLTLRNDQIEAEVDLSRKVTDENENGQISTTETSGTMKIWLTTLEVEE